jgi:hypothetical protein
MAHIILNNLPHKTKQKYLISDRYGKVPMIIATEDLLLRVKEGFRYHLTTGKISTIMLNTFSQDVYDANTTIRKSVFIALRGSVIKGKIFLCL